MNLTTPRLGLREFRASDFSDLVDIYTDPLVRRYEGPVLDNAAVLQRLQSILSDQVSQPRTYFHTAVTISPNNRVRGWIACHQIHADIREFEIGWTLASAVWGQGYATEAARAVLGYVFTDQKAHRVTAFCHSENSASEKVMQRLGMTREARIRETRWLNDAWCDELVYAILDREYTKNLSENK